MEWVDVDEWALDDWGSGLLEHWDGLELVRIAGFGGLFGWLVGGGEGWDGGCWAGGVGGLVGWWVGVRGGTGGVMIFVPPLGCKL